MKILISTLIISLLLISCTSNIKNKIMKINYPTTQKGEIKTAYFGDSIADPYRWLENDMSKETADWVVEQNKVTFGYLNNIPYRTQLKERLEKVWNYEKVSAPFKEGDYTYFYKNDGLQNQYVIYRFKDKEEPEVFLDPNTFSEDGTISLGSVSFSKDGSKLAYSISEGGSDWRKVLVMNAITKEIMEDTLVDIKFSGLSWKGNEGFYYSSYEKPKGSELSAKTDQHRLFYHQLGTTQKEDPILFGDKQKRRYVGGSVTEDNRYLVITASTSTSGNELYIKDLSKPNNPLVTIMDNFENDSYIIDNKGSKLFIVTNLNAPNKKIISVDASNPKPVNWKDFIPETENVLSPSTGNGYFFAEYMVDAVSKVKQYDYSGKLIRGIELPGVGSIGGLGGKLEQKDL